MTKPLVMNNIFILARSYSYCKTCGTEPATEPRYTEIPIVMNTMQKFKPNPDIMNECYHATDVESETDASGDIHRE